MNTHNITQWARNIASGAGFEKGEHIPYQSLVDIVRADTAYDGNPETIEAIAHIISEDNGIIWD